MEQAAYQLVFRELVVKRDRFFSRQHVHGDLTFPQKNQCLRWNVKALGHSKPLSIRFRAKCFGEW